MVSFRLPSGRGCGSAVTVGERLEFEEPRQIQLHAGALPQHAVDPHVATGLADEAVNLRQAQAGALADILGGEERIERLASTSAGHADAGIGDARPARSRRAAHLPARGIGRVEPRVCGLDASACRPAASRRAR